ncbi:MAG: P-loop NTPase [candidate division KSB1 bacterium]|nr:P-loop NTPase [candidate division KSB1 bacterium]MDQ7063423.1 P-loop NTPase [candidate division KSB1 bacterium]
MNAVFVKVDNKQFGPFTHHELRGLARKGKFTPADLVWDEDDHDWVYAEQIDELKTIFSDDYALTDHDSRIIAVGGGKGGVGKTVLTASIGVALASQQHQVVMVDADLGGANLHTVMGILEPEHTFFDFYTLNRESLNEIALETPVENLRLISGACGTLGLANPKYTQKLRFIRQLRTVNAEFLLLDLGAGSSYNVIDFFLSADEGIVVTNPEPMALQESFNFIKICLMRKLKRAFHGDPFVIELLERDEVARPGRMQLSMHQVLEKVREHDERTGDFFEQVLESFKPQLILNMVTKSDDVKEGVAIQAAAAELLAIEVDYLGYITYDQSVREAVRDLKPFILHDPKSKASQDLAKLVTVKMLGKSMFRSLWQKRKMQKKLQEEKKAYPEIKLLDKAPICSVRCFYWGDCDYQDGGNPCPVRYLEPIFKS